MFTGRPTAWSPTTSTGSRKGRRAMKMNAHKSRLIRLSGITAVVLSAGLWMLIPAWGQLPPPRQMAGMSSTGTGNLVLTKDIAEARIATAKYATTLARAQADGYKIITKMMPDMGYHFLNPSITGFDISKPPILVYEHTGKNTWQLGALEWVFTSIPKTPPLPDATFGFFPAGCHYTDGTFVPEPSQQDCPKTAPGSGAPFFFWHPNLYTMHVWVWYPNPAGLHDRRRCGRHLGGGWWWSRPNVGHRRCSGPSPLRQWHPDPARTRRQSGSARSST